jgi:hypothetical protein
MPLIGKDVWDAIVKAGLSGRTLWSDERPPLRER